MTTTMRIDSATELANKIRSIPEGRSYASRGARTFAHVARRGAHYDVECGWVVPEAYEDDYMSSTYHPFRPAHPQPWVGRSVTTEDPAEAARLFEQFKAAVAKMRGAELHGEIIGSVYRGAR
jgi:hypothetical protein